MRAGPLSNKTVSDTLNRYFVPVYTSNEDYRDGGAASPEERAAYQKIYRAALDAKLSTGTVHAYVLSPDGTPVDSLHVAEAARGGNTLKMLERAIKRFGTAPGQALVKPKAQSGPPKTTDDALVLHLTARAEGTNPSDNSWHAYPSEDWIVLDKSEQESLLPPATGKVGVGASWDLDKASASRILTHFYPQTENNDVRKNTVERASLKATVVAVNDGVARARLDGDLRMRHPFYHKDAPDMVDAAVVGYIEFNPGTRRIRTLKLATERATYRDRPFDVGVESVH